MKRRLIFFLIISILLLTACEKSPEEDLQELPDMEWQNKFMENYGFHPDLFYALDSNEANEAFARLWLENPIDAWGSAYAKKAMTTQAMVDGETQQRLNWLREMEESLAYIKECYPEYGAKLEAEQLLWQETADLSGELTSYLRYYAGCHGTMDLVDQEIERCELYRERAFRLFYIEAVCKEAKKDAAHKLEIQMVVPEGMEAEPSAELAKKFENHYWAWDPTSFTASVADNPIDAWAKEYQGTDLGFEWYSDVLIDNWKREMEESTALILELYPEMKELMDKEAAAWEKGLLGQDFMGLPEVLGAKNDLHEKLALQETVAQYRRRALYLFHLETACVEFGDLAERPTDHIPEIELILPEK
ncbi:MAG: hypothetical protein IJX82_03405 [Clostridia bacterium]|nr:hypothetical protein [Clostridia bacterium]